MIFGTVTPYLITQTEDQFLHTPVLWIALVVLRGSTLVLKSLRSRDRLSQESAPRSPEQGAGSSSSC